MTDKGIPIFTGRAESMSEQAKVESVRIFAAENGWAVEVAYEREHPPSKVYVFADEDSAILFIRETVKSELRPKEEEREQA